MMWLLGGGVSDEYLRSLLLIHEDDIFWAKLQEFNRNYADNKQLFSKEFLDEISSLIITGFMQMIESNDEIARRVQAKNKDKPLICRSLPEIGSDIYWANMKDLQQEMVQVKRNSEKKSPVEFSDEISDIIQRAFKLAIGRKATVARTAHMLAEARKKNKALSIRGSDIWMDEKLAKAEITNKFKIRRAFKALTIGTKAIVARTAHVLAEARKKNKKLLIKLINCVLFFGLGSDMSMDKKLAKAKITNNLYISVFEEFIEEYQDALDTVKADFAHYLPDHHQKPPTPRVPPPIPAGVDYDNDYDAFKKRLDELASCQRQLTDDGFRLIDAMLGDLEVPFDENGFFAAEMFTYRLLRAKDFVKIHLGVSLYMDEETQEQHMRFFNNNQEALKRAGFDPNGYPIQPQIACHCACSAA